MTTFSKFARPETPVRGVISERDLDIIEAVLRYRFSPTSELVRLVGGNEDVTQRRLRKLWEWQTINRFAFPGIRTHSEFIYYLDNRQSLEVLSQHGRLTEIHPQMEDELRQNREADYAGAVMRGQHMKLGFLQHSLMISRLHFMLEMSARNSAGQLELIGWRQGAELRGQKVELPELKSKRIEGSNNFTWQELEKTTKLPVEPDALFSLRFPGRPAGQELVHFCYEADRGSMPMADMLKKLRAYYHFVKRQQLHKQAFGVHPMRAVLIETVDESRARRLMELVKLPAVIGESKRSSLFWFAISPLFTAAAPTGPATYLLSPEAILKRVWALPDLAMLSLSDQEIAA